MKKTVIALATVALAACSQPQGQSADTIEKQATEKVTAEAARSVGFPAITNFYEKRLLKEIYERRDQADLTTYAYVQGLDGRLSCLGQAIGYGVPYSTQFSNPVKAYWDHEFQGNVPLLPQPEPNGLFTPDGLSATWLQLVAPNGDIHVVYVEPTIVVSPFQITGPAVAAGC
jgi:hypothetical protein